MKMHTVIGAKILQGSDAEFIKLGNQSHCLIMRSGMEAVIQMATKDWRYPLPAVLWQ